MSIMVVKGDKIGRHCVIFVLVFLTLGSSICFSKENNYPKGYCTWYAAEEFNKNAPEPGIDWGGDAGVWFSSAKKEGWATTENPYSPEIGSIIVWLDRNDTTEQTGYGHVAVVNRIDWGKKEIHISEMNWGPLMPGTDPKEAKTTNFNRVTTKTLSLESLNRRGRVSTYHFQGYIKPKKNHSTEIPFNSIEEIDSSKTRAEKIARIRREVDSTKAISDSLEERVAVFENVLSGGGLFAPKSQEPSTAPSPSQNTHTVDQTLFKAELINISHKGNSVFVQIRYTNKSDEEIKISYPRAILMDNRGNKKLVKTGNIHSIPPAPGTIHMAFEFDFVFYIDRFSFDVDTTKTIFPPFDLIVNARPPHGSIMFQGIQ